jgi:hypothetical protein
VARSDLVLELEVIRRSDGFRRGRGSHGCAASSALIMPLRIKGEMEEALMHWSKACARDKILDRFTFRCPKGAH